MPNETPDQEPSGIQPAPALAVEATPAGFFSALLNSPKLTASAVSLAVAMSVGPWGVHTFLGEYISQYLDIQEQRLVTSDLTARVAAVEAGLSNHNELSAERHRGMVDKIELILKYTSPGSTP